MNPKYTYRYNLGTLVPLNHCLKDIKAWLAFNLNELF